MAWFKVDDGFWSHPKVLTMSADATSLWVRAGAYACQHLTDGFIATGLLHVLGSDQAAQELVDAGLWLESPGGFMFHDWSEYQETSEEVKRRRELARERQRRFREERENKKNVTPNVTRDSERYDAGESQGSSQEVSTPDPTRPDPTRPSSPNGEEKEVAVRDQARKRATRIPDGYMPSPDLIETMRAECPKVDLEAEHRKFVDYWRAKAGKDATKLDWDATWRNWIRRAKESNVSQFPSRPTASERAQGHLDTIAEAERLMGLL